MYCPSCNAQETKVIDSRHLSDGLAVRRRRECLECGKRFTTYEKLQLQMPVIVKNDKRREPYNREKISKGIYKASQKRPVTTSDLNRLIDEIERALAENFPGEVSAKIVGEVTMQKLYQLDPVAYVRFASFYWSFKDINGFVDSLQKSIEKISISKGKHGEPGQLQQ
ncbi:transcriptional regulator NrdR [Bacteriovorax sp. Seq25_V]|uniref:transcriptional regulator NrdR n=1 Tax=Bacteriovorax sp. Seq25_V TaxID=1201288 RepID=UPI00038A1C19|nr:transcriptional regulator NrdR [Bacteriovorax sp. Seq25_V]EQC45651.1 transcriptional regulator NrdR [Bacteriovorax sp. Seq25_V]